MGRFGQKTGRGWSLYDENRQASPDPETAALIEQAAREAGIERRAIAREEIVDRCIFALVNEGARLLGEGIALRAADIDVVYLNGYAFPAWRGGPMFYADTVGLDGGAGAHRGISAAPRRGPLVAGARCCASLAESGRDVRGFRRQDTRAPRERKHDGNCN